MKINEKLLWAINSYGGNGVSGISIFCEDEKEELAAFFKNTFNKFWELAEDKVEQKYGNCINRDEEYDIPVSVKVTDYGVQVRISDLTLKYDNGDEQIDYDWLGEKALENTLMETKEKYPSISYKGYVGYVYSDSSSGDIMEHDISNANEAEETGLFDFVGEAITEAIEDDFFWDKLEEELEDSEPEDIEEVRQLFALYQAWVPQEAFERLDEILEE